MSEPFGPSPIVAALRVVPFHEQAAARALRQTALSPPMLYARSGPESAGANYSEARVAAEQYGIIYAPPEA